MDKEENTTLKDKKFSKKEQKEAESRILEIKDEEIANLKRELEKYKNQYYGAYADMQNLRKSVEKDHKEAIKYRLEGFLNDLLGVLDSFTVALSHEPPSEETRNYLVGFQYIYTNLMNILSNEGVKEISPKIGDKFDDKTMSALEVNYIEDGEEDAVNKVYLKGYQLYDHLVRPAMVEVNKKKTGQKDESNDGSTIEIKEKEA